MSIRLSNEKSTLKADKVVSSETNVGRSNSDVEVKQWEFFKKVEGLSTDYITKMLNIASTFFTPNLTMPSKEIFNKVLKASALVSAIYTKTKQITGALNKETGDRYKKKEYVRLAVKKATSNYKGGK